MVRGYIRSVLRLLLAELRRSRWKDISLDRSQIGEEIPAWPIEATQSPDPERAVQREQIWGILKTIIENDMSPDNGPSW